MPATQTTTVAIVGCGLIGSSMGLALQRLPVTPNVIGVDRPEVIEAAIERGAIDMGCGTDIPLAEAVAEAHILVLATPPEAIDALLVQIAAHPRRYRLVLDVAGVKHAVVERARALGMSRFVGGHPMAGAESSGPEHARADLFDDRPFVLCGEEGPSLRLATAFAERLGARPMLMDALEHDRRVALTSHLPHLVAQALMACARTEAEADLEPATSLAAGSWRDATRVAASDPALWDALFRDNATALGHQLDRLLSVLQDARKRLGDPATAGAPVADAEALQRLRMTMASFLPGAAPKMPVP